MTAGKIIMLQGISSAGKSTLARAMQAGLDEYWWALEADDITHMQPTWRVDRVWEPEPGEKPHVSWNPVIRLERWLAGYWGCIATIAKSGSNVIGVGGWLQTEWLYQLANTVEGLEAYCVGVHCTLEEAERREVAQGDRGIGYARSQYDNVHAHAPYDAEIDTQTLSGEQSIEVIRTMLETPPDTKFFERIRNSESYRQWHSQHGKREYSK